MYISKQMLIDTDADMEGMFSNIECPSCRNTGFGFDYGAPPEMLTCHCYLGWEINLTFFLLYQLPGYDQEIESLYEVGKCNKPIPEALDDYWSRRIFSHWYDLIDRSPLRLL